MKLQQVKQSGVLMHDWLPNGGLVGTTFHARHDSWEDDIENAMVIEPKTCHYVIKSYDFCFPRVLSF